MKIGLCNSNRSDMEPLTPPLKTGCGCSESRAKKPMTALAAAAESTVQDPGSASCTRAAASSPGSLPSELAFQPCACQAPARDKQLCMKTQIFVASADISKHSAENSHCFALIKTLASQAFVCNSVHFFAFQ